MERSEIRDSNPVIRYAPYGLHVVEKIGRLVVLLLTFPLPVHHSQQMPKLAALGVEVAAVGFARRDVDGDVLDDF